MKRRRTHWISTGFFLLLFLVGLGILLYPTFSDWYVKWRLGQEIEQYNRVTQKDPEEYAALWAEVEAYNRSVAEKENQFQLSAGEQEQIGALLAAAGSHLMGYIEIPDIQVRKKSSFSRARAGGLAPACPAAAPAPTASSPPIPASPKQSCLPT